MKKKSIEELLVGLIVPKMEVPYEVPVNWVWIKLKSIMKNKKRSIQPIKFADETFELYSVPSFPEDYPEIVKGEEIGSSKQLVNTDEVLLCKINPRINRVWKVNDHDEKYRKLASTEWIVIDKNNAVYSDYLLHLWRSPYFRNLICSNVSGVGGSLTRARPKEVENYPIPIPPLNEQKRIAEKVERLLSKIDEAKQLIEEAQETFKLRRAAILDEAFKGNLTRKWREEKGVIYEDWKVVDFDEVAFAVDPQPSHRTPPISNDGIPYIGVKDCNYETEEIDFVNARPVSKSVLDEHLNRYSINNGDFIIGKIGTIGKPFLLPTERNYVLSANVILIQTKMEMMNPKYLFYMFQSPYIENQFNAGVNSTNQAAFGIKKVRKLNIKLCSLKEQQKIVEILDEILVKENKAIELIREIFHINNLKASILQKAFRGELGTNNSSEESTIELLKEVLQQKLN